MALPFGYGAGLPYAHYGAPFGYQHYGINPYTARGTIPAPPSYYSPYHAASLHNLQAAQEAWAAQARTAAAATGGASGIKVTYFDAAGRAEPLRLALFIAGVPFEDERLTREEWNENLKGKSPFGQVPLLTVGGKVLAQMIAQLMLIGGLTGLYSDDMWERAKINEALLLSEDIIGALRPAIGAIREDKGKEKAVEELLEKLPTLLGYVEKLLTETNTGYLAGARLTIADIATFVVFEYFDTFFAGAIPPTIFEKFPRTAEFKARIAALPRVVEWHAIQEQKKQDKEAAEKAKEEAKEAEVKESKEEQHAEH